MNGPIELRQALLRYSPQFVRIVTEKLMTFALGRGVEYEDMPVIRSIVRDADRDNDRFVSILMGIVKSAPFQMRTKRSAKKWLQPRQLQRGPNELYRKEIYPAPHVHPWGRRHSGSSHSGLNDPRADPPQGHGCRAGPAVYGHLASARRRARLLEPAAGRADFEFSFITKPLEPFRKYVTLISGMDMPEAMATTEEPGATTPAARFCSRARPRRNAVSPYLGVTVDQLIAKKYGRDTILESIQVASKKMAITAIATGDIVARTPTPFPGHRRWSPCLRK